MFQARTSRLAEGPAPRLHLGAHKTATTWMQRVLALNARTLAARGVVALGPDDLRQLPSEAYAIGGAADPISRLLRVSKARAAFSAALRDHHAAAARQVILSEENLVGNCAEVLRQSTIYPLLSSRLKALPALFGGPKTIIFFAVREYGTYFASCHSQIARIKRKAPLALLDRGGLLRLPRRWPRIVTEIRDAFPDARMIVWRYEDFSSVRAEILHHLTGLAPEEMIFPEGRPLAALSHEAMVRIMREEAETGQPIGQHTLARIMREMSAENGARRYFPWSEEEAFRLRFAYAQDWAAIRALPDIEILQEERPDASVAVS